MKRWGKSPPHRWQQRWHGNPQSEQGQICGEVRPAPTNPSRKAPGAAGRLLEVAGDGHPRQMTISGAQAPDTELGLRPDQRTELHGEGGEDAVLSALSISQGPE